MDPAARASCSKRCRRCGSVERFSNTFTATSRFRFASRARYTSPMPPAPIRETISKVPRRVPVARAIMAGAIIRHACKPSTHWILKCCQELNYSSGCVLLSVFTVRLYGASLLDVLLDVGDLTLHERHLQILVHINLLGRQRNNFLRLAQQGFHFVGRLPQLNGRGRLRRLSRFRGLLRRLLVLASLRILSTLLLILLSASAASTSRIWPTTSATWPP